MSPYPFALLDHVDPARPEASLELLSQRSYIPPGLEKDAQRFIPDEALKTAIHTALAVNSPLLLTGEPGTGKTQTAYYVARMLGLGKVLHFQAKSGSTAQDLLYRFDNVAYFRESSTQKDPQKPLDKMDFIDKGELWTALDSHKPRVLLIDEIDKASRDFPNDLLHELDQMCFRVPELSEAGKVYEVTPVSNLRPLVFITSNSERRLPEAFLRRCVFHHIHFNPDLMEKVIAAHKPDFTHLGDDFLNLALQRFMQLRHENLRKVPATGEFLVWLRVMSLAIDSNPAQLQFLLAQLDKHDELPYVGVLLKDHQDLQDYLY